MKTLRHRGVGLLTTSLLFAGVGSLAPTSVQAASTCTFGPSATCFEGLVFDKQGDKTLTLKKLPTVGMGTLQFLEQTPGVWVMDVDFIPDLSTPFAGLLEFDLTIDPAPNNRFTFDRYGLVVAGPPVGTIPPVFKVKTISTDLPMIMADQMTPVVVDVFDSNLKTTRIRNDYSVTQGSVNSFQNSFTQVEGPGDPETVPGPLPLLGAGAAFGFSRRLRTRVLAARGA
jgi:hypothetical protein